MTQFSTIVIITTFLITGCIESKSRLSDEELTELAIEEGNRITMETQQLLGSTLKSRIQQDGIPAALEYCNLNAYPLVDSIENKYHVTIKRASSNTRNPQDKPDTEEFKILSGYQSDLQAGRTPEVFLEIRENEIHYARPIVLNDAVCLKCHGTVGEEILPDHYELIQELYPEDKATGYSLGDLRGIWSVRFDRENFQKRTNSTKE
jgi:hypothetical protein